MTLTQIAERFEKFLSNDIEGLGHEERDELLDCCNQLRSFAEDVSREISAEIRKTSKRFLNETPNCS